MRRLSFVLIFLTVTGCQETPKADRSPIPAGSEASVLNPRSVVVRVVTMRGDGVGDADFGFLDTGSTVFVQDDSGDPSDPQRMVSVVAREGDLKGKMVRIRREFLRPR